MRLVDACPPGCEFGAHCPDFSPSHPSSMDLGSTVRRPATSDFIAERSDRWERFRAGLYLRGIRESKVNTL
jgi:hypothetical protein